MRPLALLVLLLALALAACGDDDDGASPTGSPTAGAAASPPATTRGSTTSTPEPLPIKPASEDGEIWGIVMTLTSGNISPVLRPTALPEGFETVRIAEPLDRGDVHSFVVEYSGPGKWLRIGAGAFNPPPPGPGGYQQAVKVRGLECISEKGKECVLQVNDRANPKERVWLWWNEPGKWVSGPGGTASDAVFYLVSAEGVDPQDVVRVAESLQSGAVRPCKASDLNAILGASNGLTGGQIVASMIFGNKSGTACSLEGVPQIELVDARGGTPAIDVFSLCETNGFPCAPRQTVTLEPGTGDLEPRESRPGRAGVQLYWPTYIQAPPCTPDPGVLTIRVLLADGALDVNSVSPCGRLGVGWFTGTGP